jgi:hypothetical protein
VRLQPRTEYLHGAGAEQAVAELGEVIARLVDDTVLSVNRIDLYADWQYRELTADARARLVGQLICPAPTSRAATCPASISVRGPAPRWSPGSATRP